MKMIALSDMPLKEIKSLKVDYQVYNSGWKRFYFITEEDYNRLKKEGRQMKVVDLGRWQA